MLGSNLLQGSVIPPCIRSRLQHALFETEVQREGVVADTIGKERPYACATEHSSIISPELDEALSYASNYNLGKMVA